MSDIYVDVGPMGFVKDTKKVATKYTKNAQKLMREAAIKAVRGAAGFTADKKGPGYQINGTLAEVSFGTHQGMPSVTCKLNGNLANYPETTLVAQSLNGSATIAGDTSDGAVNDCISEAMGVMMTKSVIPALRKLPKP